MCIRDRPSQLVLLDNWHTTDTVLYFKPGFIESRRHTSNLQASIYFQVRSCTMLFVVFLKHYHTCRSIMRLEIQISVCLARSRWYRPRPVSESISVCFIGSRWNKRHTYVTVVAHRFFAFCDGKKCVVFDKKKFLSHFRWAWKLIFIMSVSYTHLTLPTKLEV